MLRPPRAPPRASARSRPLRRPLRRARQARPRRRPLRRRGTNKRARPARRSRQGKVTRAAAARTAATTDATVSATTNATTDDATATETARMAMPSQELLVRPLSTTVRGERQPAAAAACPERRGLLLRRRSHEVVTPPGGRCARACDHTYEPQRGVAGPRAPRDPRSTNAMRPGAQVQQGLLNFRKVKKKAQPAHLNRESNSLKRTRKGSRRCGREASLPACSSWECRPVESEQPTGANTAARQRKTQGCATKGKTLVPAQELQRTRMCPGESRALIFDQALPGTSCN